jgi:mRNA-degrading endonuclease RelE of RelBE toxin-antitoxin system
MIAVSQSRLKMARGKRSSRAGNWRIIYVIHDDRKLVEIEAVKHRRDAVVSGGIG